MIIPALMHRTHHNSSFNASFLPLKDKHLTNNPLCNSFHLHFQHQSWYQYQSQYPFQFLRLYNFVYNWSPFDLLVMGTENNLNDLRVASFSCYLKPIEGVVNMFDHHPSHDNFTDMSVMDLHKVKPSIFTARTPSLASEATSWSNSQGALLQRKPPSSSGGKRWFQSCTGPCYTKKSVYVQQSIKKGDQFAFPVINPTMDMLAKEKEHVEELPRMSIEVFGSGTLNKGDIAKNLVRKMSILTWDAIPKSKESVICDDMASEASSDLFEIENISKSGWQPSESSCMSPSTQYAPSEASIEWSVVTASAADYSSVYSGYDERNSVYNGAKTKIEPQKKSQRKLDNGLLGCKNYKSVKVVEPVKSKY